LRQALALFVTFEGGEGSGKSIQARALYKRVSEYGIPVILSQEPGSTSLGIKARRLLKQSKDTEISPLAELFLFAASRAQLVVEVVRPSLERGTMVICDRYAASTVAYQGYGRGLDLNSIQAINTIATQNLLPDLVILLDIPVETGLARKGSVENDRFDSEEVFFHQRVREGYIEMAAADPKRWFVVDASLPRREVERIIWDKVEGLLQNKA